VTTAIRVFGLALATGELFGAGDAGQSMAALGLLIGLAAAGCGMELHEVGRGGTWVSAAESIAVAVLLVTGGRPVEPLLVYLAVPPIVAGVRHGVLTSAQISALNAVAVLTAATADRLVQDRALGLAAELPWLAIGLGGGLLAASQTRSVRRLEAAQAPYAAAHRLVGQLHDLVHDLPIDLDVARHAADMVEALRDMTQADGATMLVLKDSGNLEVVASDGGSVEGGEDTARLSFVRGKPLQRHGTTAMPLRVGDHVFGAIVLALREALPRPRLNELQQEVDEQAIRLDTAILLDGVRSRATDEERHRLARDIHDGVAQQVVSLAYLAEEIADLTPDPAARQGADQLRGEITRLVDALRFHVFDLRHGVDDTDGLSAALSEYVRQLGNHSPLRVHLTLDETGPRLPQRTETELLRIAQEAIGNVDRHAHAINVWVSLATNGTDVRLVVEDDGVGGAAPRAGHYGLHTMRERAERIGADLDLGTRPDGGTVVTIRSRSAALTPKGTDHEPQRLARR
jgi:signal transduction histidine kinase